MLDSPSSRAHVGSIRSALVPRTNAEPAPFERYARDPVGFFRSVLGVVPWGRHHGLPEGEASQVDLLEAVRDCAMVAHRSGHKIGKAVSLLTLIPTPSGWSTMGDLRVGDELLDERQDVCRVTGVSDVFVGRPCFDVLFSDGTVVTADAEHEWKGWTVQEDAVRRTERLAVPLRTEELDTLRRSGWAWFVDHRHVVSVEPRPSVPVRCIEVDSPSRLFLCTKAFVPTHNSSSGAGIALWWVLSRPGGLVILTAPSYDQVKKPIWAEIRLLVSRRHPAQKGKKLPRLPGRLNVEPHSGYELGPNWGIWGKSTDKPERIAGPSGPEVLYVIDEGSGFDERLLEAIQGGLAGNGTILILGNPTRTSGAFYDIFDPSNPRHGSWKCLHTSSTSTPNFFGRAIPGLADPRWLEDVAKPLWGGPGNPIYDVRVLGKFPGQASNSIVSLDLLHQAKQRWLALEKTKPVAELGFEDGRLELGLDIARDGEDETIVFARRGNRAYPIRMVNLDPRLAHADEPVPLGHQAALGAVLTARELRKPNEGPSAPKAMRPRIKVDEIGNGAAALDHLLARFANEFEIVGVKVSEKADATVRLAPGVTAEGYYANKRAQLVYGVRDWMAAGGTIPPDGKLDAELVAPTWHATSSGKIAVESKDEIKKRLRRSPDRADSAALSCYEPPKAPPRVVTEVGDGWGTYSVG